MRVSRSWSWRGPAIWWRSTNRRARRPTRSPTTSEIRARTRCSRASPRSRASARAVCAPVSCTGSIREPLACSCSRSMKTPGGPRARLREKRVEKRYLARVHGAFSGEREVDVALESRGARVRVVSRGGRRALSRVRALETGRSRRASMEVLMRTGVRHQIRASLAHLGFPVVGDSLYGSTQFRCRGTCCTPSRSRWEDFAARGGRRPPEEIDQAARVKPKSRVRRITDRQNPSSSATASEERPTARRNCHCGE